MFIENMTRTFDSLPEGWREVTLSAVAKVYFSSVDKHTYSAEQPVRLCNYVDVYTNDYITGDLDFMGASATQQEIDRFGLQAGDVIITKDSETPDDIGVPAVVDYTAPDLICGYHLGLIRPDKGAVDPTFLSKQLGHNRLSRYFSRQANGLTRYSLPIGAVMAAPIWLPELGVQKAIGAILRLLDALIAKTEVLIAKLKQVRTGLLHDLLTRGLDENGQLRPPSAEAPHLYKDSPIGPIPREWDRVCLDRVCEVNPETLMADTAPYFSFRYLDISSVDHGRVSWESLARLTFATSPSRARRIVKPHDVLLCTVRPGLQSHAFFKGELNEPVVASTGFAVLRPKNGTNSTFLFYKLFDREISSQLRSLETGSNYPAVNETDLRRVLITVPSEVEQACIAKVINGIDETFIQQEMTLIKFKKVRRGLHDDLLTGRVRVPKGVLADEGTL